MRDIPEIVKILTNSTALQKLDQHVHFFGKCLVLSTPLLCPPAVFFTLTGQTGHAHIASTVSLLLDLLRAPM